MSLVPAAAAIGLAALAGAHPVALALAGALWLGALRARGILELLLLLAAPIAVAASTPLWTLGPMLALGLAVAALAALPLLHALGPGWPRPRAAVILLGACAVAAAFVLLPPGNVLAASDLAAGALVVGLAAGLLAFSSVPA